MIQIILLIMVASWFLHSARKFGKSPMWAVAGVLAFLAPSLLWSTFSQLVIYPAIPPDIFRSDYGTVATLAGILLNEVIGVGIGLIFVFWIYKNKLRLIDENSSLQKQDSPDCSDTSENKIKDV